jgi:o-succinylbenzoate synthase
MHEREGTLIRLRTDSGFVGWGEASPYPGFGLETVGQSRAILGRVANELCGFEIDRSSDWISAVGVATEGSPMARAAAETAMLDIVAREKGSPLRELLAPPPTFARDSISCNALVVGSDLADLAVSARAALSKGFRTFKLKVGVFDLDVELSRVACLRDVVGSEALIRLDANQAYEPESALDAIEGFARHNIEYLEQPVAAHALEAMSTLREKSPIPLAADESVMTEADAAHVIDAGAADVIVIKPSVLGGPLASLRIARAARRSGLQVVVTSLLDSVVAVSAAREVAGAIAAEGELPACGLATSSLFERDVMPIELGADGGLKLSREPGLGIDLQEDVLRSCLSGPVLDFSG